MYVNATTGGHMEAEAADDHRSEPNSDHRDNKWLKSLEKPGKYRKAQ